MEIQQTAGGIIQQLSCMDGDAGSFTWSDSGDTSLSVE